MNRTLSTALTALLMVALAQSAQAKNPLSGQPSEPGNGAGHPNGLNLGHYVVSCVGGKASVDVRTVDINGRRQMAIHSDVTRQFNSVPETVAGAFLFNGDVSLVNVVYKNPISMQVSGGDGFEVNVLYSTNPNGTNPVNSFYSLPNSPLARSSGNFPLISNGHGQYSLPVGNAPGAIPKNATILNMAFYNVGNPEALCTPSITDLNELRINGVFVPIRTDGSQSCGSDCKSEAN